MNDFPENQYVKQMLIKYERRCCDITVLYDFNTAEEINGNNFCNILRGGVR